MNHSDLKILFRINKELSLNLSTQTLESMLLSHQDYPSLLSISDVLTKIGVANKMGRVSSEQFMELSPIFLASSIEDGFVLVTKISSSEVSYYKSDSNKPVTEKIQEFLQKWNGIIMLLDTEPIIELSKRETKIQKNEKVKFFALIVLVLFSLGVTINGSYGIYNLYFLTKLTGFITSILIVVSEMNVIQKTKFCITKSTTNCDDILNSGASKIFSWLSMSDLGLIYFSSCSLAIMIASFGLEFQNMLVLISCFSLCTFFYIPFSIYYQYKIVKKWCLLCLIIQGVFFTESLLAIHYFFSQTVVINTDKIIVLYLSILLVTILWAYLKNPLYQYFIFKESSYKYKRLKNTPEVFQLLHKKEIDTKFNGNQIIFNTYENKENPEIILLINPFCHLCAKEFQKILETNKNSNGVNFSLIFYDPDSKISELLIELYFKLNNDDFFIALADWFKHKNEIKMKDKYSLEISENAKNIATSQNEWCIKNNLNKTPLIIFNNQLLSQHYELDDVL
ncbi:vitamin K epoxide reductase family protein [Aquimarina pacifica]|uniref:vitamin K epoxide reductase family protein n=1 Tax=Aquimarina pacifica TaxID=1296415 RepID=UPI000472F45F|nr:vitamin K epoxide reductase family protein [Aquimarina pacifica]